MMLDLRAQAPPRRLLGIVHEQDAMRIADGHRRRPTALRRRPSERKLFVSTSRASGISFQSRRGSPISTVTIAVAGIACNRAGRPACRARTRVGSLSSISSRATQRAALPQDSTSPPSALRMRMDASAPFLAGRDHDHLIAADAEDGGRRCARASRGSSAKSAVSRVEHHEIIAQAVHFAGTPSWAPYRLADRAPANRDIDPLPAPRGQRLRERSRGGSCGWAFGVGCRRCDDSGMAGDGCGQT